MRVTHVHAQLVGQQRDQLAALPGFRCARIERDRLRVLAEDELRQLLGVGLLERREAGRRLQRAHDAVDDPLRRLLAERPHEEPPRVVEVALGDELAATSVWWNSSRTFSLVSCGTEPSDRHLAREPLDLLLRQVAEHLGRSRLRRAAASRSLPCGVPERTVWSGPPCQRSVVRDPLPQQLRHVFRLVDASPS